jgi:hypothetical protein
MSFASWDSYPTEAEVKARIDEFTAALARGDLTSAFQICPVVVDGETKHPADKAFFEGYLDHAVYQFLDGQSALDGEELDEDNKASWLRFLTSPLSHGEDELGFEMPDAEGGEVLINVPLKSEMTDITARYRIKDAAGKWHLYFENFDVM